eukprot:6285087-Lingulodinium_polyedra.AAC.1
MTLVSSASSPSGAGASASAASGSLRLAGRGGEPSGSTGCAASSSGSVSAISASAILPAAGRESSSNTVEARGLVELLRQRELRLDLHDHARAAQADGRRGVNVPGLSRGRGRAGTAVHQDRGARAGRAGRRWRREALEAVGGLAVQPPHQPPGAARGQQEAGLLGALRVQPPTADVRKSLEAQAGQRRAAVVELA